MFVLGLLFWLKYVTPFGLYGQSTMKYLLVFTPSIAKGQQRLCLWILQPIGIGMSVWSGPGDCFLDKEQRWLSHSVWVEPPHVASGAVGGHLFSPCEISREKQLMNIVELDTMASNFAISFQANSSLAWVLTALFTSLHSRILMSLY